MYDKKCQAFLKRKRNLIVSLIIVILFIISELAFDGIEYNIQNLQLEHVREHSLQTHNALGDDVYIIKFQDELANMRLRIIEHSAILLIILNCMWNTMYLARPLKAGELDTSVAVK